MATPDADPAALLAEAKRQLGADPAAAARLARRVLALRPGMPAATFVLGAALRRAGDPAAPSVLAALAGAMPAAWGVHFELGMAQALGGDAAAAVVALGRAAALNPQSSLALHALGDQLMVLGRDAEAAAAHGKAVPGMPHDAALAPGVAALFDGQPGAAALLATDFGLHLADAAALRLVADTGLRLGRCDGVAALLAPLMAAAPDFAPARYALALAHYRRDRFQPALAAVEPLVTAWPANAAYRSLRAAIRLQLGDAAGALADHDRLVAADARSASLWHARGHALQATGNVDAAIAAYRRALALDTGAGEAWWSLANLKTLRFSASDVAAMQAARAGDMLTAEDRMWLDFALGKALADGGDHAGAFASYASANAARRAATPYDGAAAHALVERTIATCTTAFFAERAGTGVRGRGPVFIVGMPRSGSTLVEQILASHSAVEGASELPELPAIATRLAAGRGDWPIGLATVQRADFAALGAEYLARTAVHRRLGRALLVDKFPGNFLHIGLIRLILPDAIVIDVRRGAMDCCWSLFTQGFAAGQGYAADLADLGRAYADYVALLAHFDAVLPGAVLRVSYEALVADPEAEIARLLDHCGLAPEPACARFFETRRVIRTPSAQQVRRPINRDGIGQWRPFAPWLTPLQAALGPLAAAQKTGIG